MLKFSDVIQEAVSKNVHIDDIFAMKTRAHIARMKTISNKDFKKRFQDIEKELNKEITSLVKGGLKNE
jgi:hypothetical protein